MGQASSARKAEGGEKMIFLMILVLCLEALTLWGIVKIIELVACRQQSKGTDFWLNIISYDHKKKGGDKN